MLKSYLNCRYIIFNEANKKNLNLKKKEKNISDLKRLESGNLHEDKYFEILKKKYSKVINIKDSPTAKIASPYDKIDKPIIKYERERKIEYMISKEDIFADSR